MGFQDLGYLGFRVLELRVLEFRVLKFWEVLNTFAIVYQGYIGNNGKDNGNYDSILGYIGIMATKVEGIIVS